MVKKFLVVVAYILLLFILGFQGKILIAFLLVFLHELVHFIAARILGYDKGKISFIFIGLVLKMDSLNDVTPREDIIISIAGPLFNLMLAMVSLSLWSGNKGVEIYKTLYYSNLTLGLFNLIPAYPLDGGRVLRGVLGCKMNFKKANRIAYTISLIIGIVFMLFYFTVVFSGEKNISFGLITLFIILASYTEMKKSAFLIMGDMVRKKVRFIKKKYIEGRTICIHEKIDLLDAMGYVDKYRFSTFLVLNDNMQVVDMFYEDELIKGLKNYGNVPLSKFLKTL